MADANTGDTTMDAFTDFDTDHRCQGCFAAWNARVGAFECGYPLADCGAMMADAEEDAEEADALEAFLVEREAEEADRQAHLELLQEAFFGRGACRVTEADAATLDEWEEELDGGDAFYEATYREARGELGGHGLH